MLLVAYTIVIINEKAKKAGLEVTLYLISKTPLMQTQGSEENLKKIVRQSGIISKYRIINNLSCDKFLY